MSETSVLNNPLKYTDPSGNLWYALPSVSWSYYGGLSVGVGAGFGFPSGISVGVGVNYGFKNNNWTFTANTSLAGFYAYGGYDTKAGWIGGAGFGLSPAFTGNFSVSSNLFNVGFNYSQNGGWSASALGFNYSSQGLIFDPSITVSYSLNWYSYIHFEEFESGENIPSGEFQYSDNDLKDIMAEQGVYFRDFGLISVSAWKDFEGYTIIEGKRYYAFRGNDGILQKIPANGGERTIIRGLTKIVGNPWSRETEIYMSRILDKAQFFKTLNHELIHAYHYHIGLHLSLREKFDQYTEYVAYKYSVSVGSHSASSLKKWGGVPYSEQVMPPTLLWN